MVCISANNNNMIKISGKVIQKEQKNHSSPTQEQNDFIKKWVRYRNNKRNVAKTGNKNG